MSAFMLHLIVFTSGAADEALAVFWVHNAERGNVLATGLCSALQGLSIVVGVGASVRDWHYAATFVIGYAAGAMAAVRIKNVRGRG